ncbi:MAG: M28 family peptidase, partial [Bacteroidetes bacterium]
SRTEIDSCSIQLDGETYAYGQDFFARSGTLPDALSGNLVFAGYGIQREGYDNLAKVKLQDRIAVILAGDPEGPQEARMINQLKTWGDRGAALEARGAKAALILLPDSVFQPIARWQRRVSTSITDGDPAVFPILYLSESMGEALLQAGKSERNSLHADLAADATPAKLRWKKVDFSLTAAIQRQLTPTSNVLAYLEGTDKKDELIVVTGHYDHIGMRSNGQINNGADDDASGTSGVLEVAQAFAMAADAGYRPRRSMLFMTVSGEEKGLLGSEFYSDHPVYPLEQTVTNLNIDMIGRIGSPYYGHPDSLNYIYVIGADRLSSELHDLHESVNARYTRLRLDYTYNAKDDPNRFYSRSDHYNFAKHGIPVIFYFNGTHEDYHQPTDTPDKIEYEKAAKVARLVFHTAWELANRENRPVVDKPVE